MTSQVTNLHTRGLVRPQVGQEIRVRTSGESLFFYRLLSTGKCQYVELRHRDQLIMDTRALQSDLILAEAELVELILVNGAHNPPQVGDCLIGFLINTLIPRRYVAEFTECVFTVDKLA